MEKTKVPVASVSLGTIAVEKRQSTQVKINHIECPIDKRTAAAILGISEATLDEWTARYGIPHYKYDMDQNTGNRGKVAYLASDILEFRERYRREGPTIEDEVEKILAKVQGS